MDDQNKDPTTPQSPSDGSQVLPSSIAQPIQHQEKVIQPSDEPLKAATSQTNNLNNAQVSNLSTNAEPASNAAIQNTNALSPEVMQPIIDGNAATPAPSSNSATNQPINNDLVGLKGSNMPIEREGLPKGVYVILAFTVIGFVINFFRSSTNIIDMISLFVSVGLAIGLLLRSNLCRKIEIVLSCIIVVLFCIAFAGLFLLQQKANSDAANARSDLNTIKSSAQAQQNTQLVTKVNNSITKIQQQDKLANSKVDEDYVLFSIVLAENLAIAIYLKLPKVKNAFTEEALA